MTPDPDPPGVHLSRDAEDSAAVDALTRRVGAAGGGRAGLDELVTGLDRRARRVLLPLRSPGWAWTWDAVDRRDPRWWPQGVTTSADAHPSGRAAGRHLVVVAWYAKALPGDPATGQGVRLSFLDHGRRRYRHVLVVVPHAGGTGAPGTTSPLRAHAGGLVWAGDWLHIAATARGFVSCRLSDLLRLPDGDLVAEHFGYRYLLPVRQRHRASADDGVEPLRYSFLSLDRASAPPGLLVGEYARRAQSRRLARFELDPDTLLPALDGEGRARPSLTEGVAQMQGAVVANGTHLVTTSRGPWRPGSVWVGEPGRLRERRWATPMGPEDLAYDAGSGLLWSASEHPRRRWVYTVRADRLLPGAAGG